MAHPAPQTPTQPEPAPRRFRARETLGAIASGVVAGVSDNDPTSVATLAIIGATLVYDLNWLILLILPMLLVVQILSARVGMVTHCNLVQTIRDHFGPIWCVIAVLLILGVNLFTIGADLEGGAAALGLMFNLPWQWFVVPLAVLMGLMLVVGTYDEVTSLLKYLVLVFLAYIFAAFLAHPDWSSVLYHTFVPTIRGDSVYVEAVLALLGTTLTSYVYVWESIEEQEERRPLQQLRMVELDAAIGIAATVILFWFITVATGATLGVHHEPVETAQDAARALAPIAGRLAEFMFALGLLASTLLAVPILAATSAYAVSAPFRWRGSLNQGLDRRSFRFYGVIIGSLVAGASLTLLGISPIQLLFDAGIVGGVGTPLLLVFLLLIAGSRRIMGHYRVSRLALIVGSATTLIIGAANVAYLLSSKL